LHGAQTDENVDGVDLRGEREPHNGHDGTGAEDELEFFRVLSKETACAKQGILTLRPYISLIADQKVGEMA
jgi:hypothetical protein